MLERWTLHPAAGSIQREVLDPTPRRFAHCGSEGVDGAPRSLWTTGNGTIGRHDLVDSRHVHHSLRPDVPGDLVFVADTTRQSDADGGWLVGFVHDASGGDDRAPRDRCRRHRRAAHRRRLPSLDPSLTGSAARGSPRPNDRHSDHHQRRRTDHEHHPPHRLIDRADHRRPSPPKAEPVAVLDGARVASPSGGSSAVRSRPAFWERSC